MKEFVMTWILWFLLIPYNLLLLFSPLAVIYFIFGIRDEMSMFIGIFLGGAFFVYGGLFPNLDKKK